MADLHEGVWSATAIARKHDTWKIDSCCFSANIDGVVLCRMKVAIDICKVELDIGNDALADEDGGWQGAASDQLLRFGPLSLNDTIALYPSLSDAF